MNNLLRVVDDNFIYKGKNYKLQDLLTVDFYKYSDTIYQNYKNDFFIENELFFTFIQPILAIDYFIKNNHINKIELNTKNYKIYCSIKSVAIYSNVQISTKNILYWSMAQIGIKIQNILLYVVSAIYLFTLMISIKYTGEPDRNKKTFSIIRLNQTYQKLRFLLNNENICFDFENVMSTLKNNKQAVKNGIVYNRFKLNKRLKWIIEALVDGIKEMRKYKKFLTQKINIYCYYNVELFYSKRIIHTLFYSKMIEEYFSLYKGKDYITGNIIDRYALIEAHFAKKNNIKIYTIPHGIEYGFLLPYGLVGDKFYATSEYARDYFNSAYNTDKFIYDYNIMKKMLKVECSDNCIKNRIIFFTEAHEQEVNIEIIKGLHNILSKYGINLTVKLHPLEKKKDYKEVDKLVSFEDSFEKSINNSICIARRSTILVEALYNNSKACSILINENDYAIYRNYPSLQDKRIKCFYNINELGNFLISEKGRN